MHLSRILGIDVIILWEETLYAVQAKSPLLQAGNARHYFKLRYVLINLVKFLAFETKSEVPF